MKSRFSTAASIAAMIAGIGPPSLAQAQMDRYEALANSSMAENRPTDATAKLLRDELLFQRAAQTYLWALPLINTLGMKFGSEKVFGTGYNVLPVWKKRLDAKTLVTTPNSDVIYAMNYIDVGRDGPMVMEAPAGLQGILLDFWQRPIPGPTIDGHAFAGDVGLPGPDGGKGGKFLILPPGYDKPVPDGYFVYRSGTNNVFVFLRSFYQDPEQPGARGRGDGSVKIYPLGAGANAKPMQYPDASGVPANLLPVADGSAFDQLKWLVDTEGPNLADPDWIGMLAAIGIVKGQPFNPDARDAANSRSRSEDRLQDQPRDRFRGCRQRPEFPDVPRPSLGQSPHRRQGHRSCPGVESKTDISITTPASGSSRTTIRGVPAWPRQLPAGARGTLTDEGTSTLTVNPVSNLPPGLDLDANNSNGGGSDYTSTFTIGGSAIPIADIDVTITDPDSTTIASARISMDRKRPAFRRVILRRSAALCPTASRLPPSRTRPPGCSRSPASLRSRTIRRHCSKLCSAPRTRSSTRTASSA